MFTCCTTRRLSLEFRYLLTTCIAGLLLFVEIANAEDPTDQSTAKDVSSVIREALDKPIDLNLEEAPLTELAQAVETHSQVNVLIDRKALEDAAIDPNVTVTLKLEKRPIRQALSLVLNPLELTVLVKQGALVITTKEHYAAQLRTQTYTIGDLKSDAKPSLFGTGSPHTELIELITTAIQPNSWDDVGGPGTIAQFDNVIVIGQVDDVLGQVGELLSYLRKVRDAQAAGQITAGIEFPDRSHERRLFDQRVSLDFDELPLAEALDKLREMCGGDIVLDAKALEDAAIASDTSVTLKVHDLRLKQALYHLLQPLELIDIFKDGVLLITTREKCAAELLTQIYPISDLVDFKRPRSDDKRDELKQLLISTVQPNTWDDVGGPGSIFAFAPAQCLVISQTQECHGQIHELLADVRRLRKNDAPDDESDETEMILRVYQPTANVVAIGGPTKSDDKEQQPDSPITIEQIVQAVQTMAAADSWEGTGAAIQPVGKFLFIRQTRAAHHQVNQLLQTLSYRPIVQKNNTAPVIITGSGGGFF